MEMQGYNLFRQYTANLLESLKWQNFSNLDLKQSINIIKFKIT